MNILVGARGQRRDEEAEQEDVLLPRPPAEGPQEEGPGGVARVQQSGDSCRPGLDN